MAFKEDAAQPRPCSGTVIYLTKEVNLTRIQSGNSIQIYPDDAFIVSYPRSGNTWLRFIVSNLLYQDELTSFVTIEDRIADIYRNSQTELEQLKRPRILKSHKNYDPAYPKVLYVVRDPRDVAVSYYYYHLKQQWMRDHISIDQFVSCFVNNELLYGSWQEHVAGWRQTQASASPILLLQYEHLQAQPEVEISRIAAFLGVNIDKKGLDDVIRRSSSTAIRELEAKQAHIWKTTKTSRHDIPFIRSATTGSWKTELSEASAALIAGEWRNLMKELCYL